MGPARGLGSPAGTFRQDTRLGPMPRMPGRPRGAPPRGRFRLWQRPSDRVVLTAMADVDCSNADDSLERAVRSAIAGLRTDALAGTGDRPLDWAEVHRRFATAFIPDLVAGPVSAAIEEALAGDLGAGASLLERASLDDQNVEIPILAASFARAAGGDPEPWHRLARERYVELFQSARRLIDTGHPYQALSILLRQAPFAPLLVSGGSQRSLAMARLLSLIGSALDDASRYQSSEAAYLAALALLDPEAAEHLPERAKTLSNLGALHQLDGQFGKSSTLLDAAVAAFERVPASDEASYGLAAALINRGHSASYRGRPEAAEADWRRAIELAAGTTVHHDSIAAEAAIHLAGQQFDSEHWEAACATMRIGWRAALRADDGARRAELIALAAQGALRAFEDQRARRLYALARRRFEALAPNHLADYLDALRGEARAIGYAGDFEGAFDIARRALDEGREALGPLHEQNYRTQALLADLCWDAEAYAEGRRWAERARDDARALFPADHPSNLMQESRLAEFLLVEDRSAEAIELLLDVLAREHQLTERLIDSDSDLVDLSAIRTAKSQLDLATLATLRMEPQDEEVVARLVESRLRFGGSGVARLAARRSGIKLPDAIGPMLFHLDGHGERRLIATTTLYREQGMERRALALWSASGCSIHDLGAARDIDEPLLKWRRSPWRPAAPAVDVLLEPLHAHAASCDQLLWFPDNALALVPLAPLFSRTHPRLLERFAIVQSRDAYAAVAPVAATNRRALLVGVSDFPPRGAGRSDRPLPYVRTEIDRVAALYPQAVRLLDADATITGLTRALADQPSIVHIATHGLNALGGSERSRLRRALHRVASDDPLGCCAILMSDPSEAGHLLTARAVAGWRLETVRLFVLAACDSGVALNDAAEGSLGFQAALHYAGVATILSSLWPIGDAESADLMAAFHRYLAEGVRPSVALQRAQLEAVARGDNPATWGGLVLSGVDLPLGAGPG